MYRMWLIIGFVLGFFLAALLNVGLIGCALLGLLVGAGCYLCAEADDKASKREDE